MPYIYSLNIISTSNCSDIVQSLFSVSYGIQFTQCVPLATEPGWLADRCSVSQQLGALQTHTTDTFLFISHTTNVLLFKFRCNIFIGVRIIKEMSGSVPSGTPCISPIRCRIKVSQSAGSQYQIWSISIEYLQI